VNRQAEHDIRCKTRVLEHAKQCGNVSRACRYFGVSRDTFYRWKRQLESGGPKALINSKPCPENPKIRIPREIEENILHIRREFSLGQVRISWYLERHYGIKVSPNEDGVRKEDGVSHYLQEQEGIHLEVKARKVA